MVFSENELERITHMIDIPSEDFQKGSYSRIISFCDEYVYKVINEFNILTTEIFILKNLSHKNIIKINDITFVGNNAVIKLQKYPYTLMDIIGFSKLKTVPANIRHLYIPVDDDNSILYHRLKNVVMEKIISDIVSAMAYLSMCDIIHGDIKPSNILIDIKDTLPTAILIDFNTSQYAIDPQRKKISCVQTINYRAPEVNFKDCLNNSTKHLFPNEIKYTTCYYDNKIDIWSLGCIIYELITCKKLFIHVKKNLNHITSIYNRFSKLITADEIYDDEKRIQLYSIGVDTMTEFFNKELPNNPYNYLLSHTIVCNPANRMDILEVVGNIPNIEIVKPPIKKDIFSVENLIRQLSQFVSEDICKDKHILCACTYIVYAFINDLRILKMEMNIDKNTRRDVYSIIRKIIKYIASKDFHAVMLR